MNARPSPSSAVESDDAAATAPSAAAVLRAAERAGRRIAPLWPLKHFVAVNPFLGLAELRFADAARVMARTAGARMTPPRSLYAAAIACGRIGDVDLAAALMDAALAPGVPRDVAALKAAAAVAGVATGAAAGATAGAAGELLPTVTDVASAVTGRDWSAFATERVSSWAASHFDEGQAAWRSPWRDASPYAAWRAEAMIDRTPEVTGLAGFRQVVADLPETADEAIVAGVDRLGLDGAGLDERFHRLLMSVGGWAGYARYRVWVSELHGGTDATLVELLAIRLAWDVAVLETHRRDDAVAAAWTRARQSVASAPDRDATLAVDMILQSAYERAWQRTLLDGLGAPFVARGPRRPERRGAQAAFCIDVRSEVFRRALESVSPDIETIGFAGFFGIAIEYVPFGRTRGEARCPVLLTPGFTVLERVGEADEAEETALLERWRVRRRAAEGWKSFKSAAVAAFGFVETMGWTYAGKLASDAFGLTRTVPHPAGDGLDARTRRRLGPRIAPGEAGARVTGIDAAARLELAEAILGAMSMRQGLARLVLLIGHGSTTVNNPHATGLDCGACGGHGGAANARIAAAILNDPEVRTALAGRGLDVPADTVFLGGLHDTTTDAIELFDGNAVPPSHVDELARLERQLAEAARLTRAERALQLNLEPARALEPQVLARARDWSQVRPEWGLAGCAAFIAAPRERSAGLDLGGRAFLHSYDWRQDEGFGVLELIMTAPMVVASWISLQYYGSTVDNRVFGSGDKVLHNVVGTLGVLEGNGGDLRVGLPWQSVHDGERLIHEPLRLSVVVAAPTEAIDAVLAKHDAVRQLVENGWLHLFALTGERPVVERWTGERRWTVWASSGDVSTVDA